MAASAARAFLLISFVQCAVKTLILARRTSPQLDRTSESKTQKTFVLQTAQQRAMRVDFCRITSTPRCEGSHAPRVMGFLLADFVEKLVPW